jgi:hypothetical protein
MRSAILVAIICGALAILSQAAMNAGSQCGQACPYGNNDCPDPTCSRCNGPGGFGGVCVKGQQCFANCTANTDCDQTGECTQCWRGQCSAGCGMKCKSDKYCRAAGCSVCIAGQCQLWVCGQACQSSSDCQWGSCTHCDGGFCRAHCGAICKQNSDCSGTCSVCGTNGTCVSS